MTFLVFPLFMASTLLLALWLSAYLMKRAVTQVIGTFCEHDALRLPEAKTIDELGLRPPNFMERMTRLRDYKPYALKFLADKGIVNTTFDGKLYLVEQKLNPAARCKK
jgi:hypothetical protein